MKIYSTLAIVFFLFLLAPWGLSAGEATGSTIELHKNVFVTKSPNSTPVFPVVIVVENAPDEASGEIPKISVLGETLGAGYGSMPDSTYGVRFAEPKKLGHAGGSQFWHTRLTVTGFEKDGELKIPLWLALGDVVANSVDLTIKKEAKIADFSWTVTPPPSDLVLTRNKSTDFVVKTGDHPARGLRVVQSTLQNEKTSQLLTSSDFRVCVGPQAGNCSAPNINDHQTAGVELQVPGFPAHGKYTGQVTLGIDNHTTVASFPLSIYSSSLGAVTFGVLAIILGVFFAFLMNVLAPHLVERSQALIAVTNHLKRIDILLRVIDSAKKIPPKKLYPIKEKLNRFRRELDEQYLIDNGIIPKRIPEPYANSEPWAENFKTHMEALSVRISVIGVLVDEGVQAIDEK